LLEHELVLLHLVDLLSVALDLLLFLSHLHVDILLSSTLDLVQHLLSLTLVRNLHEFALLGKLLDQGIDSLLVDGLSLLLLLRFM
jgi:hypothetical protein